MSFLEVFTFAGNHIRVGFSIGIDSLSMQKHQTPSCWSSAIIWGAQVVFESPVQSGYLALMELTKTETG